MGESSTGGLRLRHFHGFSLRVDQFKQVSDSFKKKYVIGCGYQINLLHHRSSDKNQRFKCSIGNIYMCILHLHFPAIAMVGPSPLLRPSCGYLCWRSVVRPGPLNAMTKTLIHGPVLDEKVFFYLLYMLYITYIYHKHQPNVYCKYTSPIYPMVSYTISFKTISWWVNSMLRVDIES